MIADTLSHEDLLGHINLDNSAPDDSSSGAIVIAAHRNTFLRDMYVGISDYDQNIEFLGRVISGPYHANEEQGVASDKAQAVVATPAQQQNYYVHGTVEILGQLIDGTEVIPTATRPRPYSKIYIFPHHQLRQALGIEGDLYLGQLVGNTEVEVYTQSTDKNFLPRNVGVFGTVGSGKSNTAQVLVEEALEAGWAVVVLDVEGEYVRMNEPADDPKLTEILRRAYHLRPKGVDDFHVYVPSSGSTAAEAATPFKVPISALHPEIVADILELTEAEIRVFGMITHQAGLFYASPASVRPYSLQHLVDGLTEEQTLHDHPMVKLLPLANAHDVATASILQSKLVHLGRSGMLDWNRTVDVPELPVDELLVGGRLSVLDVSETDDRSRNLGIAYLLQALFEQVITIPKGTPMTSGRPRPPLLVVIEEIHTYVSRAAAPKMRAVLDNLQIISRRGRKRWMALALVSQQPNHVPDEIFELANTRFIHQIKSPPNLDVIKQTTESVGEKLWSKVPAMRPGQCLLAGAVFRNPLFINVRPTQSRRLFAL